MINRILAHAEGRRIAAVVNDFGAIGIDAELIEGASDGVVSLANGCICCTLEGDLLRTLATLLRRDPRPDCIVIETSGIADPADIVRNLMDPVIFREAPLETVLCVVDAAGPMIGDVLFRSQVRAADIVALSKTDLAPPAGIAAAMATIKPAVVIVDAAALPMTLLFPADPDRMRPTRAARRNGPVTDRFETFSWTSEQPISLPRLQAAIGRLSPKLARAKGFFESVQEPGRPMVFQLAAGRATLAPARPKPAGVARVRIVFIAELGAVSAAEIDAAMATAIPEETRPPSASSAP